MSGAITDTAAPPHTLPGRVHESKVGVNPLCISNRTLLKCSCFRKSLALTCRLQGLLLREQTVSRKLSNRLLNNGTTPQTWGGGNEK